MRIPLGSYIRLLYRYLRPQWPQVLLLACLLAGSTGLQLWSPQIIRRFIDVATSKDGGALLPIAGLFLAVALSQQAALAIARYVGQGISWTATNRMRVDLAAHLLGLDMAFHKAHTPGEIIERIDGDINSLTNFFSQFFIDLLSNGVLMLGVLVMLFREDAWIGLALSLFAAGALVIFMHIRRMGVRHVGAVRQTSAETFGFLGEVLTATADLRASGAVPYVRQRFHRYLRKWLPQRIRAALGWASLWISSLGVFAVGNALAFGLGAWFWSTGRMTLGTVYLLFSYTDMLRRPMEQIRIQLQDLQQASAAIGRVEALFATRSALEDGPGEPIPAGPLAVEFAGVSFGYEPGEPVLHDLNLSMRPGEVVGLLGRTGSGKSSIARLLMRLHDPSEGCIRLGGVDSRQARLAQLRSRVGMVTQDVQLFAASVRDNLTFFDERIPDRHILAVLADLGLTDWLDALPSGLDTELAAGGQSLSAGEAQLLAMARIFLLDPGLVILDEASSRLDPATEHRIERVLERLLQGRTAVIIAHRLATVQRADTIVVLEQGRVLEMGPRAALAAEPSSRFAVLLQTGQEELLA